MLKLIILCLALLGLSGCSTYLLDVEPPPGAAPSDAENQIDKAVDAQSIYTDVYAETDQNTSQNVIDACKSDFVADFVMQKQTNIALTALIPLSKVELPLYVVSNAGQNCQVQFQQSFLLTPQLLDLSAHPQIAAKFEYDVKGSQQISKYITDATALAALFVPSGGAPALATVTAITNSPLATDVSNDVNNTFGSSTRLSRAIASFDADGIRQRSSSEEWQIFADEIKDGQIVGKTQLGVLKVTVEHNSTRLGTEANGLPTYPDPVILRTRQLLTWNSTSNTSQTSNIYNLLNTYPDSYASHVEQLQATDTASVVKNYCASLRGAMQNLGLNAYDSTAFLWAMYSQTPRAAKDDWINKHSDCLAPEEMNLITTLKPTSPATPDATSIKAWLWSPPTATAAPTPSPPPATDPVAPAGPAAAPAPGAAAP